MDPLKRYAKLYRQLRDEKARLEARLAEINTVPRPEMPVPSAALDKITGEYVDSLMAKTAPRGGSRRRKVNGMTLREAAVRAQKKRKMNAEGKALRH